uniref:Uncharacterized protein n=1 Tax=Parascaris univalens TaxID=6257 RepID=A0A915AD54_PARUN
MLTRIFLLFLPLILSVTSDDCMERRDFLNTFDAFTNCLSVNITENYKEVSNELKYHTRKAVRTCFLSDGRDKFPMSGRCAMNQSELNEKAWDRNGPLRDCKLCRTFASAIVTATLYTPPEEARCFLVEIVEAVLREGVSCILKKDPAFPGLPPPVIEKPSQEQIADLVSDISDYIIIQSRVKQCAQNDSAAATVTEKCLEKEFPGYLHAYNKGDQLLFEDLYS